MIQEPDLLERPLSDQQLQLLVLRILKLRKGGKSQYSHSDLNPDVYEVGAELGLTGGKQLRAFLDKNGGQDALNLRLAEIFNRLAAVGIVMRSPHRATAYILTQRGEEYATQAPDFVDLLGAAGQAERLVDNYLREHCLELLLGGNVDDAVRAGTAYLETRIRKRAGLEEEKLRPRELAKRAFHPQEGVLKLSDDESAYFLFAGTLGLFRPEPAHRIIPEYDPVRARQILALIDLLVALVEEAEKREQG